MKDPVERRRKAQKKKYPKNWARISRRIRFERASGRCEWCGKPHGEAVLVGANNCWAGADGRWFNRHGKKIPGPEPWPKDVWWKHVIRSGGRPPEIRESVVVLQTAHLDHDPTNCADDNLAALCQFCHAEYDAAHRMESAGISFDLRRGQKVLWK
ncbi:MAG: hypothetical protein M5U25_03465 [Planctomycetota bacterium]|nr:hypothetical protein [Planctomycetota bacterium]